MSHRPIRRPSTPPPVPRAGVDPIDTPAIALRLIGHVAAHPPRAETIAVGLDRRRCGVGILTVDGTVEPDTVLDVGAAVIAWSIDDARIDAVCLASVRPQRVDDDLLDDIDRWFELDDLFALTGLELIDWFVFRGGPSMSPASPRQLIGEPTRWAA